MLATPERAVGSRLGPPLDMPSDWDHDEDALTGAAVAAELRYADGSLASIRTRTADAARSTVFADCPLGELELNSEDGEATLTLSFRDGRSETTRLSDGDTLALEARRLTRALDGDGTDALLAPRDGSVLRALEQSLETGQVVAVEERSTRANLMLVEGRGVLPSTPRGRLHVVGN